jgi:hypothetical protein
MGNLQNFAFLFINILIAGLLQQCDQINSEGVIVFHFEYFIKKNIWGWDGHMFFVKIRSQKEQ